MMGEMYKRDRSFFLVHDKDQYKACHNVHPVVACKIVAQRLIAGWIFKDLSDLLFKYVLQMRILSGQPPDLFLACRTDGK